MLKLQDFYQALLVTTLFSCPSIVDAQISTDEVEQNTATLRIKFLFEGDVPNAEPIDVSRDPFCVACGVENERLVVNDARELQNVVLLWDERKNVKLTENDYAPAPDGEVEINIVGCRFEPHIFVARVGQELVLKSSDETAHSTVISFFKNDFHVCAIKGANEPTRIMLQHPELVPTPVECNVHPWEKAYLIFTEHPFVGVSGSDGVLEIKDLPVGKIWFKLWHESSRSSFEYVMLNNEKVSLEKGRIAIDVHPGTNDLGVAKLQDVQFKSLLAPLDAK